METHKALTFKSAEKLDLGIVHPFTLNHKVALIDFIKRFAHLDLRSPEMVMATNVLTAQVTGQITKSFQ